MVATAADLNLAFEGSLNESKKGHLNITDRHIQLSFVGLVKRGLENLWVGHDEIPNSEIKRHRQGISLCIHGLAQQ
jgi:hypothetical protein